MRTTVLEFGQMAYGTESYAKVGRVTDEFSSTAVQVGKTHAPCADKQSCKLVADNGHQDVEDLHTAQQTGVLQHVIVGIFFICHGGRLLPSWRLVDSSGNEVRCCVNRRAKIIKKSELAEFGFCARRIILT